MAGRCLACEAEFGIKVWDLVLRQGVCPHCGGELEAVEEEQDEQEEEPPQDP